MRPGLAHVWGAGSPSCATIASARAWAGSLDFSTLQKVPADYASDQDRTTCDETEDGFPSSGVPTSVNTTPLRALRNGDGVGIQLEARLGREAGDL